MVARSYNSSQQYRYGFNGMEHEDDAGSFDYDFGARMYDSRIARWLSLEPLLPLLPGASPYIYCVNNPIFYIEPDGKWFDVSIVKYDKKGEEITWGWFGLLVAKKVVTYKLSEFYLLDESSKERSAEAQAEYIRHVKEKMLSNFNTGEEGVKSRSGKKTIVVKFEFANEEGLKIINNWDEIEEESSKARAHLILIVDDDQFKWIVKTEGGATDSDLSSISGFSPSGKSLTILPRSLAYRERRGERLATHESGHSFFRLRDKKNVKNGKALMYNKSELGDGLSYKEFKRTASWFTRTFAINGGVYNPNPNKNKVK